jgi:chromosome segregation ATPase
MNRVLNIFNLLGICALAALCAIQWNRDRDSHTQIIALQAANQQHEQTIQQQTQAIRGQQADLDDFRNRLMHANDEFQKAQSQLATLTQERDRLANQNKLLAAERDEYKAAIPKWSAALAARDNLIKQASGEIIQLAQQRNEAIVRFNDLVAKYNALAIRASKPSS